MVIRRAGPETDQLARSLLQKAVRRGSTSVAVATARYLVAERNELPWLRGRLAVMTVEEAWPYVGTATYGKLEDEIVGHYVSLSRSSKNKDASGLGSLAYAFSEGDATVLNGESDDWFIRVVAKAIGARDRFWKWIETESITQGEDAQRLAIRAMEASKKAGWPWDKAFAYSAALLAAKYPVPALTRSEIEPSDFPFWIAIDKHTPIGKAAIREAAATEKVPANTALWLSFYLESGLCRNLAPSQWWDREKKWRFAKLGLLDKEANAIWATLRPMVIERLAPNTEELERKIRGYMTPIEVEMKQKETPDQMQPSLFS